MSAAAHMRVTPLHGELTGRFGLMLQNLGAVASNYRRATIPLPEIGRRLAGDVTSGRRADLRAAASSIAAADGAGVEDTVISNDRPVGVVARDVMTFLGWLWAAGERITRRTPIRSCPRGWCVRPGRVYDL